MIWLRDLDWPDLWRAVAVALFVLALVIWADCITGIIEVARLE